MDPGSMAIPLNGNAAEYNRFDKGAADRPAAASAFTTWRCVKTPRAQAPRHSPAALIRSASEPRLNPSLDGDARARASPLGRAWGACVARWGGWVGPGVIAWPV